MATAPQPAPVPPPQPSQPDSASSVPLSWEGDRMFNIYIYDYCFKRGFRKTARELLAEADLTPDSAPPINARQGLLFEWWSVFWVLFTAKNSNNGPDEAMLYTQFQNLQQQQRSRLAVTGSLGMTQPGPPPIPQHQPQSSLLPLNGRPGPPIFTPGPRMNGVMPSQGSVQGGMSPFAVNPGVNATNGIMSQSVPPPPPNAIPVNGPSYQPMGHGGHRPSLVGGMPQQQAQPPPGPHRPNGSFQSPNMGHSPQNSASQQLAQPTQPPQHPPPIGQLGPSPHMAHRPGMQPMNQGINPMNQPQGPSSQSNAPTPGQYPQPGQPPSRTGTPGQPGMVAPSPSLSARQPPGPGGPINSIDFNSAIASIPTHTLAQIKAELGLAEKDINTLAPVEKQRIVGSWRNRLQKPGGPQDNAVAGPSNPMMQLVNQQRNPQQPQPQRNPPTPGQLQQQQQRAKRNSTSPGDEEMMATNETSPPANKRLRRSPMEPSTQPMAYPISQIPQQPPQPGMPPQMMGNPPMMLGRPNPSMMNMNGQQPGQPPMGPLNMGTMGMGGGQPMAIPMGAGMNSPMGPPGSMTSHMQNQQMQGREQFRAQSMMGKQPGPMGGMVANPGPPAAGDNTFSLGLGPGPNGGPGFNTVGSRGIAQQKTMMPPPSPAMISAPKDPNQTGTPGPAGQNNVSKNPLSLESPRNPGPPGPSPNVNGGGPPTPVPSTQNPNPSPNSQGPVGTVVGGGGSIMDPSPSSMLGPPPPSMNPGGLGGGQPCLGAGMPDTIFGTDFITSVASSLDDFVPDVMFRPDGDINFERDFGQWFNDSDGGLDMK